MKGLTQLFCEQFMETGVCNYANCTRPHFTRETYAPIQEAINNAKARRDSKS